MGLEEGELVACGGRRRQEKGDGGEARAARELRAGARAVARASSSSRSPLAPTPADSSRAPARDPSSKTHKKTFASPCRLARR